jgi:Tol biopolymer transport system component
MSRLILIAAATGTLAVVPAGAPRDTAATPTGTIVYSHRFWPKRFDDNWELFARSLGRRGVVRLTRNPRCSDMWPSWSNGGRWLAFACGYGPLAGIYVIRDDGSGRRAVVRLPNRRVDGTAWSPDGRRIAFGSGGIWIVNVDGTGLRRLTRGGEDESPTWSADSRWIAYESQGDIFRIRANGTGRSRIAKNGLSPAWSPDGRWIVFLRPVDMWIMRPDGSGLRRLPCCRPHGVAAVTWSPDSRYLAFDGGGRNFPETGIYVMSMDGKSRRLLEGYLEELVGLTWGPNLPS